MAIPLANIHCYKGIMLNVVLLIQQSLYFFAFRVLYCNFKPCMFSSKIQATRKSNSRNGSAYKNIYYQMRRIFLKNVTKTICFVQNIENVYGSSDFAEKWSMVTPYPKCITWLIFRIPLILLKVMAWINAPVAVVTKDNWQQRKSR